MLAYATGIGCVGPPDLQTRRLSARTEQTPHKPELRLPNESTSMRNGVTTSHPGLRCSGTRGSPGPAYFVGEASSPSRVERNQLDLT